jgi:tetratricopeptide (TPR) repeat protein
MKIYRCLFIIIFLFFLQIVAVSGADAEGDFYYSIHGASYRELEQAKLHIISLQKLGYAAFYEKVNIPGKGLWYRVYIGKYGNREAAKKTANILRKNKDIDDVRINRFIESNTLARASARKKGKQEEKQAPRLQGLQPPPPDEDRKSVASNVGKKGKQEEKQTSKLQGPQPPLPDGDRKSVASNVGKKGKQEEKQAPKLQGPQPPPPDEDRKSVASHVGKKGKQEEKQTPKLQGPQPPLPDGDRKDVESDPAASPLDNALSAFQSEQYEQAIEHIKVLLNKGNPDKTTHEKGLRLMADCYYSWGAKGNRQQLLTAIDQYKLILQRYPDPAGENDRLYYQLAMSYEKLNFFYESSGAWEKLIFAYPKSPLLEEAMFRVGDVLRPTGKYSRTADKLLVYLNKYPEGKFTKAAYFTLGDCYYRMQKRDLASRWFDEARKKWFDLHDIPQTVLFNMGDNYFDAGRFADAFQVFSLCTSLYSSSDFGKNTLFRTARAADEAGYDSLAIKLYSLFMEKYPGDTLADECSLALANLGVVKPGMRVSMNVANMDDYREPLQTYKRILSKNTVSGDQAERIMMLRGTALEKSGTIKDVIDNDLDIINKFPRGKFHDEALSRLKSHVLSLLNTYYTKGDHLAVSDLYFRTYGKVTLTDDFDTAFKTGHSLQIIGIMNEARALYTALKEVNKQNRTRNNILTLALANMDVVGRKYGEAEEKLKSLLQDREVKGPKEFGTIKKTLADVYYKVGSFEKATALYADVLSNETIDAQSTALMDYARSLQGRQMTQAAQKNYLKVYKDYQQRPDRYENSVIADLFTGLGDGYCSENKFKEGIMMYQQALSYVSDADSKRWLMLRIGQGYAGLYDFTEAQKNFTHIKDAAGGDFWPKIADFYIAESMRQEKNEVQK